MREIIDYLILSHRIRKQIIYLYYSTEYKVSEIYLGHRK